MKMTLNEEIELLRNGKWFDKINGTIPNDEYLSLGWAIGDVLDTLELLRMSQPKVETNADRIRASSDEQLALFCKELMFNDFKPACKKSTFFSAEHKPECEEDCVSCILKLLQQPAEEDT